MLKGYTALMPKDNKACLKFKEKHTFISQIVNID
jgi:hypothetical protein